MFKRQLSASQEKSSLKTNHTSTLISDFYPPQLWENKLLLFKPSILSIFLLQQP